MPTKKLSASGVAGNVNTDFIVPAKNLYRVLYGQVVLTTDATVANRRVILQVLDSDSNVIFDTHAGAVVAATQASQHHEFLQGIFRETSFVGGALQVPLPLDCILLSAYTLRVTIENGEAGDSYTADFMAEEVQAGAGMYR